MVVVETAPQGSVGFSEAEIETGNGIVVGHRSSPRSPLQIITVVPDGVATVGLERFQAEPRGGDMIETVKVQNNVAALQVAPRPSSPIVLVWLGSDGRVLKRAPVPRG